MMLEFVLYVVMDQSWMNAYHVSEDNLVAKTKNLSMRHIIVLAFVV